MRVLCALDRKGGSQEAPFSLALEAEKPGGPTRYPASGRPDCQAGPWWTRWGLSAVICHNFASKTHLSRPNPPRFYRVVSVQQTIRRSGPSQSRAVLPFEGVRGGRKLVVKTKAAQGFGKVFGGILRPLSRLHRLARESHRAAPFFDCLPNSLMLTCLSASLPLCLSASLPLCLSARLTF